MGSVHDVVPARGEHAAFLAGLTTVILWGSAFVAIRAAGVMLSPGPIALGRLTVSSAILTVVALLRRERLPGRSAWLPTTVFGILFLGGYSLALNAAERQVDAGTSAMIVNTGPLLIALLAGVVLREGFPKGPLAGCGVALVGCVLIGLATTRSRGSSGTGLVPWRAGDPRPITRREAPAPSGGPPRRSAAHRVARKTAGGRGRTRRRRHSGAQGRRPPPDPERAEPNHRRRCPRPCPRCQARRRRGSHGRPGAGGYPGR